MENGFCGPGRKGLEQLSHGAPMLVRVRLRGAIGVSNSEMARANQAVLISPGDREHGPCADLEGAASYRPVDFDTLRRRTYAPNDWPQNRSQGIVCLAWFAQTISLKRPAGWTPTFHR